jgi:hypothetical protein
MLFHAQLPADQVGSILEHLAERYGVRATGRLWRVHRATVGRSRAIAGGHARHLHEELGAFSRAYAPLFSGYFGQNAHQVVVLPAGKEASPVNAFAFAGPLRLEKTQG